MQDKSERENENIELISFLHIWCGIIGALKSHITLMLMLSLSLSRMVVYATFNNSQTSNSLLSSSYIDLFHIKVFKEERERDETRNLCQFSQAMLSHSTDKMLEVNQVLWEFR